MKSKLFWFLSLGLLFFTQLSLAQEKSISGTVTDGSGVPLPGVNIVVKGTTNGTQTDFDGIYTISASQGDVLVFSYVGFASQESTVGAGATIDVTLQQGEALEEVVVTALGISREKKSLGYATQEVDGAAVSTAKEGNFVNSLSGKISGLDIKRATTMGGSSNVIIRGYSSITGNNQALFVIDGVPVNNDTFNTSGQQNGGDGYDYGNAASDINPDDIESVNVLKGAAATALYGSRASNGAIIITTKKGKKNQGLGVTVSTTVNVNNYDPDTFAKFQNEYGQGYGPYYDGGPNGPYFLDAGGFGNGSSNYVVPVGEDASFGGRFDPSIMVYQWDSFYPELDTYQQATPWTAAENGPEYIFRTGYTDIENVTLSSGSENATGRMSYTRYNETGILPNSSIARHTFDLTGTLDLSEKLHAVGKATYTKNAGRGRFGSGYDAENIMTNFRQWWGVNVDLKEQEQAYKQTGQNITWNPSSTTNTSAKYWDNPYFTRYENYNTDERNRLFGYASLTYNMTDWLDVMGRVSVDTYDQIREERNNIGSVDLSEYSRRNLNYSEFNYDLFLNFDKDISESFGITGTLGSNYRQTKFNDISASTNGGLVLEGLYTLSNSVSPIQFPAETDYDVRVFGLFGQASIDYDNTVFLDASLRNDTFSTLKDGENSFYYPAISSSVIFSNLFESDAITYGKVRAGYGEVGNGAGPYQLINTFNAVAGFNGNTLYSNPGDSRNPDLKEERTNELEVGLEMAFFSRRLGFDMSLYKKETENQIFPVAVTPATGYTSRYVNSGTVQNKGLELQLYGSPVRTEDFEWKINTNFSTYESEVTALFEDSKNLLLTSFFGVTLNATLGQPYGTIKGTNYEYVNGERLVLPDGRYSKTTSRQEVIGDINPDWKAGISNSFRYKNWNLSFLIDIQEGGSVFSGDMYFGLATGLYEETAGLNDLGMPLRNSLSNGGGVVLGGVQADGTPNTVRADFTSYANPYGRYGNAPDAQFVYDASYVKLRELTLSYSLPQDILENLFLTNVTLTATGRNLWIISKDLPYADPEAGFSAGNVQGFQIGAYPATKQYGLNVKLQF